MRQMANGKVRREEGEWRELLALFESSDLRQCEFCKQEGVSVTSFQYWKRKLAPEGAKTFVELPRLAASSRPSGVELVFPDGLVLRVGV